MDGADGHHPFRLLAAAGLPLALSCDDESVGQFQIRQGWFASLELLFLQLQPFDVGVAHPQRNTDCADPIPAEVEHLTIGGRAQEG